MKGGKVVTNCNCCGGGGGTGACCSGDSCSVTTAAGCSGVFLGVGTDCSPNPCNALGACCISGACSIKTAQQCALAGGSYQGEGSSCSPDPCASGGQGACCVDGTCTITERGHCTWIGGIYQGAGTVCDPNPCGGAGGACCDGTQCYITTSSGCAGTYKGDGTDCDPSPCPLICCGFCGFSAFDGSGRKFLTKFIIIDGQNMDPPRHCYPSTDCATPTPAICWHKIGYKERTQSYDQTTCVLSDVVGTNYQTDECCDCSTGTGLNAFSGTEAFPWIVDGATQRHYVATSAQDKTTITQYLLDECNPSC